MNAAAIGLSAAGLALVLGTWISYLGRIPRGGVPARPVGSVAAQLLGLALAAGAVALWLVRGAGWAAAVFVPAGMALIFGAFFLWLLSQRKTPIGDLKVAVGDALLPFEAVTAEGRRFRSSELAGKRTLLKFFRGGW